MNGSLFPSKKPLERLELGAAIALTAAASYLHLTFLQQAGGLWRDEVVSFNVATQPTLAGVHEAVRYDSFPNLYHLVLRAWLGLGFGNSDLGARALGLTIGLSVLAAAWWNARCFRSRVPLFSLLLLGISGLCVRTTDAVRAYGLGVLCIALCFGLSWRLVTRPRPASAALAAAAAVLSVQALYQNAFLVGALCFSGALVCARHHLWKRALLVLSIGACAALSLAVYLPAMRHMSEIKQLIAARAGLQHMLGVALLALRDGSNVRLLIWLVLLSGYGFLALRGLLRGTREPDVPSESVLFTFAAVASGLVAFFGWLEVLGFPTQTWYYVLPMAFTGLALDAAWPALLAGDQARLVRVYGVAAGTALGFFGALSGAHVRQTNVDILAASLGRVAAPDDFIVVDQWYNGATFSRYFKGRTPWSTLPPLQDQALQRLDLFKQFMLAEHPTEPVERQIADTLRAGHKVWLVGGLPISSTGKLAPHLPPAPRSSVGWDHDAYSYVWAWQAGDLLKRHAAQATRVNLELSAHVNEYENLPLWFVQGWHERADNEPERVEAASLH